MGEKVNISQIARDLELSVSTVSRALSGKGRVSDATKQKIEHYIVNRQLVPNSRNGSSREGETKRIAVLFCREQVLLPGGFGIELLEKIGEYFELRGYQIILLCTPSDNMESLFRVVNDHIADGIILVDPMDTEIEYLQMKKIPFVCIGKTKRIGVSYVDICQEKGCYEFTNALIHIGFDLLAFLCREDVFFTDHPIYRGVMKAYMENYLQLDRRYVFTHTDSKNTIDRVIEQCIEEGIKCIVCQDENICLSILQGINRRGLKIPEEIRIASFRNSRLIDEWHPPVSCLYFDTENLAYETCQMLYDSIMKNISEKQTVLGYELLMRESTRKQF